RRSASPPAPSTTSYTFPSAARSSSCLPMPAQINGSSPGLLDTIRGVRRLAFEFGEPLLARIQPFHEQHGLLLRQRALLLAGRADLLYPLEQRGPDLLHRFLQIFESRQHLGPQKLTVLVLHIAHRLDIVAELQQPDSQVLQKLSGRGGLGLVRHM